MSSPPTPDETRSPLYEPRLPRTAPPDASVPPFAAMPLDPVIDDDDAVPPFIDGALEADPAPLPEPVRYRGSGSDPAFGYLIALALAVGLTPLIPDNTDLRYVIVWTVLAGFGVLAWLLGTTARIGQEQPENLAWGVIFGFIIATPLLAVGGRTLNTTAALLFRVTTLGEARPMTIGSALALLLFVQPLAETLFFRGVLQENRSFWLVGALASLWSAVLYFPLLDVGRFPGVALIITVALVMMNLMYSYVRARNGLAAAWLCQIVVNIGLLFIPFVAA